MAANKSELTPGSVLVTGASGYIGFAVSLAFRRAGYIVYGLLRDEKKAPILRAHEILPVIGDAHKVEEYKKYLEAAQIIVDCTSSFNDKDNTTLPLSILKATEEIAKNRDHLLPRKTYIYTSGIMVYGHDETVRDESSPLSTGFYSQWRRKVEEAVISSSSLNGIVLRPGWVYGGSGGPFAGTLLFANPEKIELPGVHHDRRYSWVHNDDLADSYVAAASKAHQIRGSVLNIVGNDAPIERELVLKSARLAGYKGDIHWTEPKSWIDHLFDSNVVLNYRLATSLLGWTPKITGFYENLEFYYESYKASVAVKRL